MIAIPVPGKGTCILLRNLMPLLLCNPSNKLYAMVHISEYDSKIVRITFLNIGGSNDNFDGNRCTSIQETRI